VLPIQIIKRIYRVWPNLWSSVQSSWLQIQRSGFDHLRYQISWEVVGSRTRSTRPTIEELLKRKSNDTGLENRVYGRRDPSRWPRGTIYPQKLALTSPTSGGRSVGIVRSQTQATKFCIQAVPERCSQTSDSSSFYQNRNKYHETFKSWTTTQTVLCRHQ
jgi:hypothetical protein